LFLDEVGELSSPLQAQLLRAVQEHKYKRVGGNTWQHTEFRLICATNRDMEAEVANGNFRADLYYRIAGWRCRTPCLRERRDDILPLVSHFLGQMDPQAATFDLDPAVREYLLTRDYPGNVRDLCQTVKRIWHRHTGPSPITIGDVPVEERQCSTSCRLNWPDKSFEDAIRHAVELGIGLKEISQNAADLAMQMALEQEGDNLQRAAYRLGVTDRALQMRRASRRAIH
jgi:transcriptional regulator with GAF, ATPase, and Fis domain